jgi:hypothetical protein
MVNQQRKEIALRGKRVWVPAVEVAGQTVVVTGRLIRVAGVHDAEFAEGERTLDPVEVRRQLAAAGEVADIFTFSQEIDEHEPKHPYVYDWDNAALACSANYDAWWNGLPQESRKNVRRASRRGVSVEVARFDEGFVKGIKAIYDETPVRQGRRFWHYGKDLETIRTENSSYLSQSVFIGAYHGGQLIGFMKFVYVGNRAVIMQILANSSHYDKRPMNAMIAKAMEICHRNGTSYLVYGRFNYGNKKNDAMAEFKRRNGFDEVRFPKYFVPLTLRGRMALALRLHRGVLGLFPPGAIRAMLRLRSGLLHLVPVRHTKRGEGSADTSTSATGSRDVM